MYAILALPSPAGDSLGRPTSPHQALYSDSLRILPGKYSFPPERERAKKWWFWACLYYSFVHTSFHMQMQISSSVY